MVKELTVMDGATLMAAAIPPIRFTIEKLLPQGLHILAGAPKVGKSWLALWLCLCVAKGEPVWDFPVRQGEVLFLCLEDSYSRIQNRLLDIAEEAPECLYFATASERLRNGLEEQIEEFIYVHPDTELIVIDTLQRVRSATYEANSYAGDYRDIGLLKELADRHTIAILLIHHLRKMGDDDPMNMISGTTGISGAADSTFVLRKDKRGSNTATLFCTGRDIEYRELTLEFDSESRLWNCKADSATAEPHPRDEIISIISDLLAEQGVFAGTPTELAALLERRSGQTLLPATLTKRLLRCREALADRWISFQISRTRERRELRLRYVGDGSDGSDGKNDTAPAPNLPSQLSQPSRD